jgi:hypothetical protein
MVNDREVRGLGSDDVIVIMRERLDELALGLIPKVKGFVARSVAC